MSLRSPTQTIDEAWGDLRLNVEWAQGFALCLLYSDTAVPLNALRQKLADSLLVRTSRLAVVDADAPETFFRVALQTVLPGAAGPAPFPVWINAYTHIGEPAWDDARRRLLARLNERRFLLERDFKRPLILALPVSFKTVIREIAPDLWHIRSLSVELEAGVREMTRATLHEQSLPRESQEPMGDASNASVVREWQRLTADAAKRPSPSLGWAAFEAAQEAGDWRLAQHIASVVVDLSRKISADTKQPNQPEALRDLSVSLNNVGQVARDLGQLEEAKSAYSESLKIRRDLRAALGDSPQALRDLSVSLMHNAVVERALGNAPQSALILTEAQAIISAAIAMSPQDVSLIRLREQIQGL